MRCLQHDGKYRQAQFLAKIKKKCYSVRVVFFIFKYMNSLNLIESLDSLNIPKDFLSPDIQHKVLSSFEELISGLNKEGRLPAQPNTKEMLAYISARNRLAGQLELSQNAVKRETERNMANFK